MFQLFANPRTISDNCSGKKRKALGGHFSRKLQNKAVQSVAVRGLAAKPPDIIQSTRR